MKLVIEVDEEDFKKIKEEGFTVGNGMLAISKLVHGTPIKEYCKSQWKERSLKCK